MEFWNSPKAIASLDAQKLHPPRIEMDIYSTNSHKCLKVTFEFNIGKKHSILLVYDGKLLQLVSVKFHCQVLMGIDHFLSGVCYI